MFTTSKCSSTIFSKIKTSLSCIRTSISMAFRRPALTFALCISQDGVLKFNEVNTREGYNIGLLLPHCHRSYERNNSLLMIWRTNNPEEFPVDPDKIEQILSSLPSWMFLYHRIGKGKYEVEALGSFHKNPFGLRKVTGTPSLP